LTNNTSMKIHALKISVRWSDLDANMHLANASYMNFTSFTRSHFFAKIGISTENFKKYQMGPIIFHENFSFFKEVLADSEVLVTFEVLGLSESANLFEIVHNLYDLQGNHLAKSYVLGSWIDFRTRKLANLPEEWSIAINKMKSKTCKTITKEILKTLPHQKADIDVSNLIF
jgi:acyl-CoA thioester hydrolase